MKVIGIILDRVFDYFVLKFGRREIYDENIYSEIHKEFVTTLVNHYVNIEDDMDNALIEFTKLESNRDRNHNYNYKYDEIETMAFHLSLQIGLLEKRGYTMLYLQPYDIVKVRINDNDKREICLYLLVDLTQLVPLSKMDSNNLLLTYPSLYPFPKGICAPELYNLNELPFITHRSATYYSLGLLCLHFLPNLSLNNLRDTPLFYFLERCLKENPFERICLFI